MPALRDRGDGLLEVEFEDGSKVAMLPQVVQSGRPELYNEFEQAPPRSEGKLADVREWIQPAAPRKEGYGAHGAAPGAERPITQQRLTPDVPTAGAAVPAAAPRRVAIPKTADRPQPQQFDPRAAVGEKLGGGTPDEGVEADLELAKQLQGPPARTGPSKMAVVKGQRTAIAPEDKAAIEAAHEETIGARQDTNVALLAQKEAEAADKAELATFADAIANERENRAAENATKIQGARDDYSKRMAALDDNLRQIREEPAAREKVLNEKGWLGKILYVFATNLAGGMAELAGAPQLADKILNDQVRTEAERQQKQIDVLGMAMNRLQELRQQIGDDQLARQWLELEIAEAQNVRIQAFAASSDSEQVKLMADQLLAQRGEETAMMNENLRIQLADRMVTEYGLRGGSGGGAAKGPGQLVDLLTKIADYRRKKREAAGLPEETAASRREREESAFERTLENPFGTGKLWARRKDAASLEKLENGIGGYKEMTGIVNRIRDLKKQLTGDKVRDQAILDTLQKTTQEAQRLWGIQRERGGYGVPTGKDEELIDKELGTIGRKYGGLQQLDPRFDASLDEVERIFKRSLKSALNVRTTIRPFEVQSPDFPLEDFPPPGAEGTTFEGQPGMRKGLAPVRR